MDEKKNINIDEAKGRVRSAYGELTGDQEQKNKGMVEKTSGKLKEGIENVKDKANEFFDRDKK